ncbi:uncharacterized protein LOC123551205 [Mercenaria mercenaria]|uniref:uncharacterized protein LOC123551205 n=1 Tax=Mercenaria mercenaria TaxID=6596 RepID=UPI00234F1AC2|nr:uncharacterized protein LOC123551205 [Mercenaria mercenaria]
MHDKLIAQHRYFKPNFKNSNIKEWRTSPLQIGLCNIGSNNKADIKSLEDLDPAAILQILINDMEVTSDPSDLLELLKKVKHCRDEFAHSRNMALADSKLTQLIDDIIKSLDLLPRCDESDEAKRLTLKLKDEEWEIISKGTERGPHNSVEKQKQLKEKVETCRSAVIKEMHNRENDTDQTISPFLHEMDDSLQEIAHAIDETDETQLAKDSLSIKLTDLDKKLALKEFLLKKYQRNLLETEDGIIVDEIYVPQKTMVKDENEKEPRQMTTYRDMFYQGEKKAKKIYIISKEGGG